MARLNVTLPSSLKAAVARRVASGEYAGAAEYVCELIRRDQQRRNKREIEQFLLRRLDRTGAVEMNATDFARMRRELLKRPGKGA